MAALNENGIAKVASVTVNFNTTDTNTLYTVPAGKTFIPAFVVIRSLSASMASLTFTLGPSGDPNGFRDTVTASGASATTKALLLYPNYAATPAASSGLLDIISAGDTFVLDNVVAAGSACTGIVDVFGYLY